MITLLVFAIFTIPVLWFFWPVVRGQKDSGPNEDYIQL